MTNFLLLAIVGLIAQLVDGSLGMAYGVTSQSLLLTVGIAPALASASVHIAEVGTTAASGASHWRLGAVGRGTRRPRWRRRACTSGGWGLRRRQGLRTGGSGTSTGPRSGRWRCPAR